MNTHVDFLPASADFAVTSAGMRVDFYTGDEVRALRRGDGRELARVVDWCEQVLGRPSGLVGRTGNVCPFVPEAMMRGSLRFALIVLRARGLAAVAEIEQIISACREHFLLKEKRKGQMDIFASMVMVLPDITKEEAPTVIDPSQRKFKPLFIQEGLMLGEFHPLSRTSGLRNPAFRPLRSPVPLLAIRHMVESDIDFLVAPSDPPQTRLKSIKAFLQFLGSSLSIATQVKAKEALKSAQAELNAA